MHSGSFLPVEGALRSPDAIRTREPSGLGEKAVLTFLQGPLDGAGSLADGVQVPVQRGHEQQALGQGHCAGRAGVLRQSGRSEHQTFHWPSRTP